MSSASDRRDTRRVILGPAHSARFTLKGHAFQQVRITNISPGGCFLMVGRRDQGLFEKDSVLEQLTLDHRELPQGPITAQVAYTLGTGGAGMDYVGVGVRFLAMAPETQAGLDAFVAHHLGPVPQDH